MTSDAPDLDCSDPPRSISILFHKGHRTSGGI